ncbi:MAG: VOC family protein [Cyclobacteriaceae bacterium]|nr:VOC family protein [Cyclobacteriaceae bacterium]
MVVSCTHKSNTITPRVNHVMLYVSDLEASINFYTKAFGFQVTNKLDTLIATQPDGTELVRSVKMAFLKFPNQDFVFELSQQPMDFIKPVAFLFQHLGVDVQDIETAYARAISAGAVELLPVRKVRAKGIEAKQAFVGGPDGERIELMQIIGGEF